VLLGGTLKAVKCQQIYHATCSSQVLTRPKGIDLLYGSTANAHVLLLRQENHPPPLSWTLVCCYPTKTYSQPSCCYQYPYRQELVLLLRRERDDPDQYRHITVYQQRVEIRRQQEVNMSADNYLMQEELGSTFRTTSSGPRIHPNTSQVAHSASYTALSTNGQANPWR
jgi:hypothetical protein